MVTASGGWNPLIQPMPEMPEQGRPVITMPWENAPVQRTSRSDPDPSLRARLLACHACTLRDTCKSPVPWSGPWDAPILAFGEAPGEREDLTLRPFTGQAGRELDQYLWRIFLTRDDVRVSNVTRCRPPGNVDPTVEQTTACWNWTAAEIDQCNPQLIVLMGRVAIRTFLGDVSVEETHGRLYDLPWRGRTIPVFCMTHPAAGLHNTRDMQTILTDFAKLGDYLSGVYEVVEDPLAGHENYRALDREQTIEWGRDLQYVANQHKARGEDFTVSADTEWTPDNKIWCATFCYEPGDSVLVWPDNLPLLADVLSQVRITLHSSQADIGPLQDGGIPVNANNLGDTMIAAYLLGKPQGLKAICRSECGMEMMDYSEVVNPEQRRLEYDFCRAALEVEIPEKEKGDRRATIHGLIKRCLLDMDKEEDGGKAIKPMDRWKTWDDERKAPVVAVLGEFPRASLADVDLDKAVWYACRDADGTERSRIKLEGEMRAWHSWK